MGASIFTLYGAAFWLFIKNGSFIQERNAPTESDVISHFFTQNCLVETPLSIASTLAAPPVPPFRSKDTQTKSKTHIIVNAPQFFFLALLSHSLLDSLVCYALPFYFRQSNNIINVWTNILTPISVDYSFFVVAAASQYNTYKIHFNSNIWWYCLSWNVFNGQTKVRMAQCIVRVATC